MLKSVPPVLTPDLLWILASMGHGDRLLLVNANYPAYSRHERVAALPGVSLAEAAKAILQLMPVDDLDEVPAYRMVPDETRDELLQVHRDLQQVLDAAESRPVRMKALGRAAFFDLAASSFAAVLTGDNRPYGCFVIAKGVVRSR
jgi:L-fucose mutarotase